MKTMLFAAAMLLSFISHAQVGTGLFVGGQLGFSGSSSKVTNGTITTKGPVNTTFSIKPRVGYFFTDNIAAGIIVGYGAVTSKSEFFETKSVLNIFSVGVFGRYALPLGDGGNFAFLSDLNIGFSSASGKTETTVLGTTTTVKADPEMVVSINLSPGILFFPTPKIGLEAGLGNIVQLSTTTVTDANNNDNVETSTNFEFLNLSSLRFNFGCNYYFSR